MQHKVGWLRARQLATMCDDMADRPAEGQQLIDIAVAMTDVAEADAATPDDGPDADSPVETSGVEEGIESMQLHLLLRRTITFHIPAAVLISAFVFAEIFYLVDPSKYSLPLFHLFGGGMLICAFFIATDPVTAPLSVKGMWIFGAGVGLLIMLIRIVGGYPEGVMFAILIMNSVTPLVERWTVPEPFGGAVARD